MTSVHARGRKVAVWLAWSAVAGIVLSLSGGALGTAAAAPTGPRPAALVAASVGPAAAPLDPPVTIPTVIASVNVGTEPEAGATDLANGFVYVANAVTNNVSVLNGTSLLATINLAPNQTGTPVYVVYDGANQDVYVVDRYNFEGNGGAVNVISGTTVLATVPVGHLPDMAVVDPANGDVYVTNSDGATISILDGTILLSSVPVGTYPSWAAYDVLDGDVYVANEGSANVSVVNGTSVITTLPAGAGPDSAAYDPADGDVYVANNVSNNVTVFHNLSVAGNVLVGADPSFVGYNPSVGGVEVVNTNSSNVTVLTGTTAVATLPVAAGPVWAGTGTAGAFTFVVGENANEVTILEGTTYIGNATVGSVPVLGVADPLNQLMYVLNSGSNSVTVFALGYPVLFNETGLGAGVAWSVTLGSAVNSSTSASIGFVEPFGVYAYAVGTPSGYRLIGTAPASPISVVDRGVTVNVTFAPIPGAIFNLTFVETGLGGCGGQAGGQGWSGGGQQWGGQGDQGWGSFPSWGGYLGDSGYEGSSQGQQWGGQGHQGGGEGGHCCRSQSSIPAWSVTVEGVTKTTTNTSVSFSEPNGTYAYTVDAPSGYSVTSSVPPSPVTIQGSDLQVNVTFGPTSPSQSLSITFEEEGLSYGTVWCVTISASECSSVGEMVFSGLSPGTYAFSVSPVAGYSAHPAAGTVSLSNRNATVIIQFSSSGRQHGCG